MAMDTAGAITHTLCSAIGIAGACVFYGRFYVQWYVSERRKESVIPIAFWYMSCVGSVMLLFYAVYTRSPGAAYGQCFSMVVYSRNLVHVWREKGRLTQRLNTAVHILVAAIVVVGAGFTAWTWWREYQVNQTVAADEATRNWIWLGVWAVGQFLFTMRFLIQWVVTELKKRSVVPTVFWYLSLAAATLQLASYSQRQDWVFVVGMASTIIVYGRNLWLIHRKPAAE
jgi:lipid-A-disaccharide synthase-like uncharacterized protein